MNERSDAHEPRPTPQERLWRGPPPPRRTMVATATPPPERRYLVVQGERLVGRSRLEHAIPDARAAAGRFRPEPEFSTIREVFRAYREARDAADQEALRRFVAARDALGLRVLDQDGTPMAARVELVSEWDEETLVIHVAMEDALYWERHAP